MLLLFHDWSTHFYITRALSLSSIYVLMHNSKHAKLHVLTQLPAVAVISS